MVINGEKHFIALSGKDYAAGAGAFTNFP